MFEDTYNDVANFIAAIRTPDQRIAENWDWISLHFIRILNGQTTNTDSHS